MKKLLLLILVLTFGSAANAQSSSANDPDFIVPSRPTVSNPAEFQRPGVLQLEYGYNANLRAPGVSLEQDTPLALRFAVNRRVLLEFDEDSPFSQTNGRRRTTGAGDIELGIQVVLQHEKESRPGVAFAYFVKLPSASSTKGLGTGRVDHALTGLVSKSLRGTTIDFNFTYLVAGRTISSGHDSSGQAALALARPVSKKFGVEGEISGSSRQDQQPGSLFALGAVTYQVNRRLILDTGMRFGLTEEVPRVGFFAGITVGIADLYKR
jgi:Putative MetA-pathway of phenol degradation